MNETPDLHSIFERFQKIPKEALIDGPNELIETHFSVHMVRMIIRQAIFCDRPRIFFNRRTLKHLAEKGLEGKAMLVNMEKTFSHPDHVHYSNRTSRYLISRLITIKDIQRHHVITIEIARSGNAIIITSFIAKQKYLKNFKILWRTATS